jgi:hydroxymethylglutaryl-CoA reductase
MERRVRFHEAGVRGRIDLLRAASRLSAEDAVTLRERQGLTASEADRMGENVIGTFSLPMSAVPGFLVNGREYVVPMVTEEPSVVAALGAAAKIIRETPGFTATVEGSFLIGQVYLTDVPETNVAAASLANNRDLILEHANRCHPRMTARGGGAKDIEIRTPADHTLAVHIVVDTCDAMGANLVSTMCEATAPLIERLTGGKVLLRVLSNLADRALVQASTEINPDLLTRNGTAGRALRDRIVMASQVAEVDPYRAATHNKGIMNGIDAVAIATGNDWRALEAGAHAFAAGEGRYRPLSTWRVTSMGALQGRIRLPLKVGTVGAQLECNPMARIALRVLGVGSAAELASVMAAVGLAQNFAALRMLVSEGISGGHLKLHARSVAVAAGARGDEADLIAERLVQEKEVKIWRARELLSRGRSTLDGGKLPEK